MFCHSEIHAVYNNEFMIMVVIVVAMATFIKMFSGLTSL